MISLPPGVDPTKIPLQQPPAGLTSNFVDPPSLSWTVRLAIYLTFPLMLISVILRLVVRLRNRQTGGDDYIFVLAVACAIAFNILQLTIFSDNQMGRHAWDIPLSAIHDAFFRDSLTSTCLYNATAAMVKVSLLALFLRIFRPSRTARVLVRCGMVVTVLFYVASTIAIIVYMQPRPGDGGWGSQKNNSRMEKPASRLIAAQGVGGTVTDFYVLLLPLHLILQIQMPLRRRIGVLSIFMTGLISCACSVAGLVYRIFYLLAIGQDNRWTGTKFNILGICEINIGIICCSLPVSFVLLKAAYGKAENSVAYFKQLISSAGASSKQPKNEYPSEGVSSPGLSAHIPSGIITGLRSFIQKGSKPSTKTNEKPKGNESVSSYLELQSIDYERFGRI